MFYDSMYYHIAFYYSLSQYSMAFRAIQVEIQCLGFGLRGCRTCCTLYGPLICTCWRFAGVASLMLKVPAEIRRSACSLDLDPQLMGAAAF